MGPSKMITSSEEAYRLYREARSHWQKRTPLAIRMAIRCLDQAVALDGTFALASALLADCHSILMDYGVVSPKEGMTAARLAIGRAMKDGAQLAESLTASALVRQMDLDWPGAEAGFDAAIEAHPEYTVARQRFALFLAYMGRDQEGLLQIERAFKLGASYPAAAATAAWIPYYQGNYEEAIWAARKAHQEYPAFSSASVVLGLSMIAAGQFGGGSRVLEHAFGREPENVSLLSLLAYALGRNGNRRGAEDLQRQLFKRTERQYVSPYYLAIPSLALGHVEKAFSALERGVTERSPHLVYLVRDPIFKELRAHPRLQAIRNRIGLPLGQETGGNGARPQAPDREREAS